MNIEKLKACIVYTCSKASQHLDAVKLNKVLWYSDAAAYMSGGESITGARYIRQPRGPVAGYMPTALKALEANGAITLGRKFDVDRGVWLDDYAVSDDSLGNSLDAAEKESLDYAIKRVCRDHTTVAISERTHGEIWEIAANGEEIPLFTMFAERLGKITKEHIDAAFAA